MRLIKLICVKKADIKSIKNWKIQKVVFNEGISVRMGESEDYDLQH